LLQAPDSSFAEYSAQQFRERRLIHFMIRFDRQRVLSACLNRCSMTDRLGRSINAIAATGIRYNHLIIIDAPVDPVDSIAVDAKN